MNVCDFILKEIEKWNYKTCFPNLNIQKGYESAYDMTDFHLSRIKYVLL